MSLEHGSSLNHTRSMDGDLVDLVHSVDEPGVQHGLDLTRGHELEALLGEVEDEFEDLAAQLGPTQDPVRTHSGVGLPVL